MCVTRFVVGHGKDLLGEDTECTGISVEPMPHSHTLPMLSDADTRIEGIGLSCEQFSLRPWLHGLASIVAGLSSQCRAVGCK